MLHLEGRLHAEVGTFLDSERLVLEPVNRTRWREVDDDIRSTLNLQHAAILTSASDPCVRVER